jgi:hypothetical protein
MTTSNDARESVGQRFPDRLKQLWGESRRRALTPVGTARRSPGARARSALQVAHHRTASDA